MDQHIIKINGNEYTSIIWSWKAWHTRLSMTDFKLYKLPLDDIGICKICHGYGVINDKTYGVINCICTMQIIQENFRKQKDIESLYQPKSIESYKPWGDYASKVEIENVKKEVKNYIDNPTSWLIFVGNNGTGKTHLLQTIATALNPWSLYITAPDLEGLIFEKLKNKDDENSLQDLIDQISCYPFLLIDDIGSDYGSDFPKSAMRKIVDHRYRFHSEYPTVFSTNLGPTELCVYDRRIGDRVYDQTQNNIFVMRNLKSYRRNG